MVDPDVVAYLQANLKKFPLEDLRKQLSQEGVSAADFDAALKLAKLESRSKIPAAKKAGILFLVAGVLLSLLAVVLSINRASAPTPAEQPAAEESAFLGHSGFVLRLPRDYTAVSTFKDPQQKTFEVVHFHPVGVDPSNFLNEGLYGQLGIVRLEVHPSPLAGTLQGLESLTHIVTSKAQQHGEKFHIKNIQVSSLRGIEITIETPFPRFESYILGKRVLYNFIAGQDDEIYRDLVSSLRDPQSEN